MKASVTMLLFLSLFGLNFSHYRKHFFVNKLTTWKDAQTYCRKHYSDLSTVNEDEAQRISEKPEVIAPFFWIGLHRSPNNSEKWIWSGGEDEKTDNWDTGEPNSIYEDCGAARKYNYKLHNAQCAMILPFYCMQVSEPMLVQQKKTWEEALIYCRHNYIELVSLTSQMIMAEVINNTMTSLTDYIWTGLRFMAGHWFWVNGDDLQYKAWPEEGEQQCPAGNLRCGALDRENNVWRPRNCEDKLKFVCLKKL